MIPQQTQTYLRFKNISEITIVQTILFEYCGLKIKKKEVRIT